MPAERVVTLAGEADFDGFRAAARRLLADCVEPWRVTWTVRDGSAVELFAAVAAGGNAADAADAAAAAAGDGAGASGGANESAMAQQPASGATSGQVGSADGASAESSAGLPSSPARTASAPRAPPDFIDLCRDVVLHNDRTRFALLYRLLWRLQREPGLRSDPLDADAALARRMAQAVRRDQHKMKAFVRFREVPRGPLNGAPQPPLHVAWFEPEHHIVDAVAPFFVRRFTSMPWAILTPERCLQWNGESLETGPGASRHDAPAADAGEALWLTYYESIFNPARLKLRAMQAEMPRRYWHNLPEARLISTLAAAAHQRTGSMVERAAQPPARRLPAMAMATEHPTPPPPRAVQHLRDERGGDGWLHDNESAGNQDANGARSSRADALHAVRASAAGCRECPLGALATQTVWGEGPADAQLMLVGEQPGDQEDLQGRPFVGPAGQLLDKAMQQLGWDRSLAYVTNAVKHFKYEPRGKRRIHKTPAQREADACEHWLDSEIALVRPKAIIALGATAARQLLGRPVAVMRERGQWLQRVDGLRVLVTLHPSALLRLDAGDRDAAYAAWLVDLRQASSFAGAGPATPLRVPAPPDGPVPATATAAADGTQPEQAQAQAQSAFRAPMQAAKATAAAANAPPPSDGRA